MTTRIAGAAAALTLLVVGVAPAARAQEDAAVSGYVEGTLTGFADEPRFPQQVDAGLRPSAALRVDAKKRLSEEWDGVASVFARVDPWADRRVYGDVRDAYVARYGEATDFRAGIFTEYWGVLEATNIVDIINYRDLVDDFKGKTKLGQPGISFSKLWDGGRADFYVLPYARGQLIPDEEDRFRLSELTLRSADFQGGRGRPSLAGRLTFNAEAGDLSISHFHGTSREPTFRPHFPDAFGPPTALEPRYDLIDQTALELQTVRAGAVWKVEAFGRSGDGPTFLGIGGGLEREFVRTFGYRGSLTTYLEGYLDGRDDDRSPRTAFDHDLFLGARYNFNDLRSTEIFAKALVDLEHGSTLWTLEGGTRWGNVNYLFQADWFTKTADDPALRTFGNDQRLILRARVNF